jgi:3-oxoadipate enol-lactonase
VHGLSFRSEMFEAQVAAFRDRYRCLTFDLRGHGQTEATPDGYDMETFTDDAAQLIEKLGIGPVHFVGWSIGGFMGLRLAIRRPELLRSLILVGAGALRPSDYTFGFKLTPFMVGTFGMGAVIGALSKSMFDKPFRTDPARSELHEKWKRYWRGNHKKAIAATARGVLNQSVLDADLVKIHTPTLVINGEHDEVCVPAVGKRTAAAISGAKFVAIPRAGHACNIEEPEAVNRVIGEFLAAKALSVVAA